MSTYSDEWPRQAYRLVTLSYKPEYMSWVSAARYTPRSVTLSCYSYDELVSRRVAADAAVDRYYRRIVGNKASASYEQLADAVWEMYDIRKLLDFWDTLRYANPPAVDRIVQAARLQMEQCVVDNEHVPAGAAAVTRALCNTIDSLGRHTYDIRTSIVMTGDTHYSNVVGMCIEAMKLHRRMLVLMSQLT